MVNREACELYIEQEIKAGLDEGKNPNAIGRELSILIQKIFETKIKPETLKKRAERLKKKKGTNVPNFSKDPGSSESTPKDNLFKSGRGGKRKGAGKPALKVIQEHENIWINILTQMEDVNQSILSTAKRPSRISQDLKNKIIDEIGKMESSIKIFINEG